MAEQIPVQTMQQLEDKVLALGGLAEQILIDSADLLRQVNLDALERLGDDERQIHKGRLAIEMECMRLIANDRPRDRDLRRLVAMVEIAAELEHIGEHARRLARVNYLVADHQLRQPLASIQRLAQKVQCSLHAVLEAFARGQLVLTEDVLGGTSEANAMYRQIHQELLMAMKGNPRLANQAIYLSRTAYNLRRVAEHVTGVGEWVGFSFSGTMGESTTSLGQSNREVRVAADGSPVI
ncbi:MAG: phosphate signaling complex PhoU family protein [Anaerolineae bacterium]